VERKTTPKLQQPSKETPQLKTNKKNTEEPLLKLTSPKKTESIVEPKSVVSEPYKELPTMPADDLKQRSKSQTISTKHESVKPVETTSSTNKSFTLQQPTASNTLSALDDFDAPFYPVTKLSGKQKLQTTVPAKSPILSNQTSSSLSPSMLNTLKQKQRIVVPHEKFSRVMGRGNCNIKVIQEVTGAMLELEEKKIPPNNDRSILIRGETLDATKYAFELLQALISDSDLDLVNLLPSNRVMAGKEVVQSSVNSVVINKAKSQGNSGQVVNKWNTNNDSTKVIL